MTEKMLTKQMQKKSKATSKPTQPYSYNVHK